MAQHLFLSRCLLGIAALAISAPSSAYIYWSIPVETGEPVNGDEPGIMLPLPGATPKELRAGLLWNLRAGLNVAALQCQFEPSLRTVDNYNQMLRQHGTELQDAYATLGSYFKRTASSSAEAPKGKGKSKTKAKPVSDKVWKATASAYDTRIFAGFATFNAQLSFCETAASIGRDALAVVPGKLGDFASQRMREFRNSLKPIGDVRLDTRPATIAAAPLPDLPCVNDRGKIVKCKRVKD